MSAQASARQVAFHLTAAQVLIDNCQTLAQGIERRTLETSIVLNLELALGFYLLELGCEFPAEKMPTLSSETVIAVLKKNVDARAKELLNLVCDAASDVHQLLFWIERIKTIKSKVDPIKSSIFSLQESDENSLIASNALDDRPDLARLMHCQKVIGDLIDRQRNASIEF